MNTGTAPPPQSLSRRRGLSNLPLEPPLFPDAPSPLPTFSRRSLPQAVSTEEKESYRMSAIQNLHSFGKLKKGLAGRRPRCGGTAVQARRPGPDNSQALRAFLNLGRMKVSVLVDPGDRAWALGWVPVRDRKGRARGQFWAGRASRVAHLLMALVPPRATPAPSRHSCVTSFTSPPLSRPPEREAAPALSDKCARQWGGKLAPPRSSGSGRLHQPSGALPASPGCPDT